MEVIAHEAIAKKLETLPLLDIGQRLEKGLIIARLVEHLLAIVATIDHMIDKTLGNRTKRTRHARPSYRL